MRKLLSCAALTCAVAFLSAGLGADDKKDDKTGKASGDKVLRLEGSYTIESGERGGKALPAGEIKGSVVRFTKDRITGTDKDKKEFFSATYTLDASKTPAVITMKSTSPKEAETTGIVKSDGDTVTIAYALPGGTAPTEFKTKEHQQMFVLKRSGKDGDTKGEKGTPKP